MILTAQLRRTSAVFKRWRVERGLAGECTGVLLKWDGAEYRSDSISAATAQMLNVRHGADFVVAMMGEAPLIEDEMDEDLLDVSESEEPPEDPPEEPKPALKAPPEKSKVSRR